MIIVTMTSWTKRINNVKPVVEKVMKNTVKPDRIYLNLSKTEFNGIELPKDLVDYFNSDDRLVINWVDGENTKSMKKVFPILQYLDDDDIIINIDDDLDIPADLVEIRMRELEMYGSNTPVSGSNNPRFHTKEIYGHPFNIICPTSIFKKKMLNGWDKILNDELVRTYNDDFLYTMIMLMNGYKIMQTQIISSHTGIGPRKIKLFNDNDGMGRNRVYKRDREVKEIFERRYKEVFKKDFSTVFSNEKQPVSFSDKHDCVMMYGKSGVDSQEMTCGEHLEIEYVVASLKKYCSSWCGRIFIVGSEPPEQIKNDVIHIPCDNPYTHCKDANIIHKIRYACENISDLTEDFLVISDDQIVTKESSWNDMKPRIKMRCNDIKYEVFKRKINLCEWDLNLIKTLDLFPQNKCCFWEPHIWSPMNKHKFIEMCKKYDYQHNKNCIVFSLYYNFINESPLYGFDHTHFGKKTSRKLVEMINTNNVTRHVSWTDEAFSQKRFRDFLGYVVGFNTTFDDYKNSTNMNKIMQLRKDIHLGNIVHVYTGNGKFTWKKIK